MPGLENQIEDRHDFDGECMPSENAKDSKLFIEFYPKATFSVGIFRWLPKASGKGLKKSKVIYRIRGKASDAEKVYSRAREVCRGFDKYANSLRVEGPTRKSETVK